MTTAAASRTVTPPPTSPIAKPERLSGHVKWYDTKKGFGFIVRPGEKDVFVRSSDLRKSGVDEDLAEGEPVTFELGVSAKGPKAVGIRRGL
jgi:CspA family cold shock protein